MFFLMCLLCSLLLLFYFLTGLLDSFCSVLFVVCWGVVVCLFVCMFAWFNWSDRCIHVFTF